MKYKSKKRIRLLEERFIAFCDFTITHFRPPTVRECVVLWGFSSTATSAAHGVLLKLVEKGWITATKKRSRNRYYITGMSISLPDIYFTLQAKPLPRVGANETATSPTSPTNS